MPHWVKTVKLPPGVGVLAAGVVAVVVVAAAVVVELFEQEVAIKAGTKAATITKTNPNHKNLFFISFHSFLFFN
jgi:hypothetical protein